MRTWIRLDLPVVAERLALAQCCDDNYEESDDQEYSEASEYELVRPAPDANCDAFQELRDREFAGPDEHGIEYSRRQYQSSAYAALIQFGLRIMNPYCFDIVRAVQQHDMNEGHSDEERNECKHHYPVFREQLVTPRLASTEPDYDYDRRKYSTPPAEQERWVIRVSSAWGGRRLTP